MSPEKKSGKTRFTNFDLQTSSTDMVKGIYFSPDRATSLKLAMQNKSPVKLTKYEFNEQYNNIVVQKETVVEHCKTPLPFAPSEELRSPINIETVKKMPPQQMVTLTANVTSLTQPKVIKMSNEKQPVKKSHSH